MARLRCIRLFDLKNYMNLCQNYANARCSIDLLPVRYLRGSRKNKNGDEDILRFQQISRTLKCDSGPIKSETPVSSENERNFQEDAIENNVRPSHDSEFPNLVTAEDLIKKLEDKFTPLQEKPYERQLKKKYRKSLSVLKQLGFKLQHLKVPIAMGQDKIPCPLDVTLPSPDIGAYRNKDDFSIGLGLDGSEKTVGYFLDTPTEFSTTFCISPKTLPIIREAHVKFAEDFQTFIRMSSLSASQHFADKGYWKNLIVRSNNAGDIMGIVIMHPQDLNQEQLQLEKEKLKDYFSGIYKSYNLQSLYFQTCTQSRCTHEQSPFELILGDPCIIEDVNNLKIHISPDSFFHVNTRSAEAMYNLLLKICRVNKSTTVFDIYCGTGPLSLTFSSRVKECIGIDESTQAISDAKVNASENGMNNVDFICGRPEYVLKDILNEGFYEDNLIVLNSSRGGISKSMITTLREFKKIKKIIYITAKPHSALDNFVHLCKPFGHEKLSGKPFLPILAVPVDLFPQTDHYGLILMFQRL